MDRSRLYLVDKCCFISKHRNLNFTVFIVFYVLIILFGAAVFPLIEQKAEVNVNDQLVRKLQTFLTNHQCITEESLKAIVNDVLTAKDKGMNTNQINQIMDSTKLKLDIKMNKNSNKAPIADKTTTTINNRDSYNIRRTRQRRTESTTTSTTTTFATITNTTQKSNVTTKSTKSIPKFVSNWEFSSSLLFITSIVTTIGYGQVRPITTAGKVFCIGFACIGIPMTLTFLSSIVSLIIRGPVVSVESCFAKRWLRRSSLPIIRFAQLLIYSVFILFVCLITPALLFRYYEDNWSFIDSFYYCFISLTTVGLGDFVPASDSAADFHYLYRIGVILYLYIGLIFIMTWLAMICRIPQFNLKKLFIPDDNEELSERSKIIASYNSIHNYGTDQ